jgi:2'-5' RNA ligase
LRTFIAIALPTQIREKIKEQQRLLARDLNEPPIRWVRPESIHLTLKFLGEISPQQAQQIQSKMLEITSQFPTTIVVVEGLGCFPNYSRPRVIWLGLQDAQAVLSKMQNLLDRSLEDHGFAPEERGFSPHLTIGRVHRRVSHQHRKELGNKIAQINIPAIGSFTADMIHLFQSELKPSGAVYTQLASASLGADYE